MVIFTKPALRLFNTEPKLRYAHAHVRWLKMGDGIIDRPVIIVTETLLTSDKFFKFSQSISDYLRCLPQLFPGDPLALLPQFVQFELKGVVPHLEKVKEGFGNQINLCRDQGLKPGPLAQRLAEEELLREAKRGAARASVSGPLGWVKCPLRPTNKRFLRNTILHTINNNSRRSSKTRKNQDSRNKSVLSSNSKTSVDSTKYQPNKRVEGHEKTNKNKVDKGSVFQTSSKLKNKYCPHITSNSPQNQHSHKTNHDKLNSLRVGPGIHTHIDKIDVGINTSEGCYTQTMTRSLAQVFLRRWLDGVGGRHVLVGKRSLNSPERNINGSNSFDINYSPILGPNLDA
uniref:Uncharacterized protein n=1 Tax=Timema shepardi TaxID=629360 RepID=A0A7R9ALR7_TIMSH|nr:unnamed protein product [Timema shepardi]